MAASGWTRRRPSRCSGLIGLKDRFDIAFACDTDHDRHGIVTRSAGLAAAQSLSRRGDRLPVPAPAAMARRMQRWARRWSAAQMIDRVSAKLGRTPVRGAGRLQMVRRWPARRLARLRRRGKRGRRRSSAAMARPGRPTRTASSRRCWRRRSPRATGRDPGEIYRELTREFGESALRPHRRARHAGAEEAAGRALGRSRCAVTRTRRRDRSSTC